MSRKARLLMISLLCVALSSPAFALIEPEDPGEPDYGPEATEPVYPDYSVTADSTSSGSVNLWPGGAVCSSVFFASRITFDVDVIPNLGTAQGYDHNPKAKITVWRANNASMNNATLLERTKRTGVNAFVQTFTGTGFYQICFKYRVAQAVDPTNPFDFMNIQLLVNFR